MKRPSASTDWILRTVEALSRGHGHIFDDAQRDTVDFTLVRRQIRSRENGSKFEEHLILDFGIISHKRRQQGRNKGRL